MTQPTGAEIPERYARWYATACDPEHSDYSAKTATLIEDVARLEAELAEAKAGWDSCIADLREAAEICKGVERQRDEARAQVERLSGPVSEQCEYSFGAYGGRLCELPRGHVEPHILSITERTKVIAARAKGGDHE